MYLYQKTPNIHGENMIWLIFTLGAIYALIPLIIILILIAAAAGSTRGASIFEIFGISALVGIGGGAKGTIEGKSISKTQVVKNNLIGGAAFGAAAGVATTISSRVLNR